MKPIELLKKLSDEGCCVGTSGVPTMFVAAAWIDGETLRWLQLPPDDQHHAHVGEIKQTKNYYDRDLAVTLMDGRTFYFAPAAEWPEIDHSAWRDLWGQWQAMLAGPSAAAFRQFCLDTVGQVPPE